MDFSEDQERALEAIRKWRLCRDRQYITMGGLAGTGKTTLIAALRDEYAGAAVCALAGKAAQVLRAKGVMATTIHSLIYVPYEDDFGKTRFAKRDTIDASWIIVDEASMIDHLLMQDLLSFHLPVLFVGDHGQLQPIGTDPGLMANPNIRLEKIHRQAADNPIIRLAHAFREGREVPDWSDPKGRCSVLSNKLVSHEGSQVICGRNRTRHRINAGRREEFGARQKVESGETLICLKNNNRFALFNGQQFKPVMARSTPRSELLDIVTEDGRRVYGVPCLGEQFGQDTIADWKNPDIVLADYGYAITAHKAQGSEWPSVVVLEEIAPGWDARRWRYTAVTRARERLIYCR